jgi:hypothetical protein
MTDASTASLITAGASLIVALVAGGLTLRNGSKANKNAFDIQDLKGAVDRDLERLKAKLSHGQAVSSTQWNVEFTAYQAIWQSLVSVRNQTVEIATYEKSMEMLNLLSHLDADARLKSLYERTKSLDAALATFARAVQDNAPFYPQNTRHTAIVVLNQLRSLVEGLLSFVVAHGIDKEFWTDEQLIPWRKLRNQEIEVALTEIESVEMAIRERLGSVRLFD